jgi:hypothetical protein
MGLSNLPVDLRNFQRVIPAVADPRLVLEAATALDRRALFVAIKTCQSHIRAHLHLSPQAKANKTLIYFTARRHPVAIEDRGDIVCVNWLSNQSVGVRVEVGKSAGEVEETLGLFLDARPTNPRHQGRLPNWRHTQNYQQPTHRIRDYNQRWRP